MVPLGINFCYIDMIVSSNLSVLCALDNSTLGSDGCAYLVVCRYHFLLSQENFLTERKNYVEFVEIDKN